MEYCIFKSFIRCYLTHYFIIVLLELWSHSRHWYTFTGINCIRMAKHYLERYMQEITRKYILGRLRNIKKQLWILHIYIEILAHKWNQHSSYFLLPSAKRQTLTVGKNSDVGTKFLLFVIICKGRISCLLKYLVNSFCRRFWL